MWDYKISLCCLEFPIFLLISNSYIKRNLNSYQGYEYHVKCIFKTILQISTWFLGQGKFPAHQLLLLCFPLLKIQQQEIRKIMEWRQRRSWGSFNFLIDWRKSPACWPAGDKNQRYLWGYHCFSTLYVLYIISLNMYFLKYLLL